MNICHSVNVCNSGTGVVLLPCASLVKLEGLIVFPPTLKGMRTLEYGARGHTCISVKRCIGGTRVVLLSCASLVKPGNATLHTRAYE